MALFNIPRHLIGLTVLSIFIVLYLYKTYNDKFQLSATLNNRNAYQDTFENTIEPWPSPKYYWTLTYSQEHYWTLTYFWEYYWTLTYCWEYTLSSDLFRVCDLQTGLLTCSRFLLWSYWTRAGISFMGSRLSLRLIQRLTVSLGMYCISRGENLYTNSVSVCKKFQYKSVLSRGIRYFKRKRLLLWF